MNESETEELEQRAVNAEKAGWTVERFCTNPPRATGMGMPPGGSVLKPLPPLVIEADIYWDGELYHSRILGVVGELESLLSFRDWLRMKWRLGFWGHCPNCNDDA